MSGKDESTGDKVLKTSASISNLLSNAFTKQMSISSQQMSSPSSQEQSPFLLSSPSSKMKDPKLWRAELPNSPFTISLGDKQINTGSIELLNLLWNDLNGKTPEEKRQIKACFEAKTTNEEILFKSYISSLSQFLQRYDNEKEGTKKEVVPRDLRHKDWSNIVGCSHSTDGSVGVTFIECTQPPKTNTLSIGKPPPSGHTIYRENIVAKPCEPEEFAKQKFLNTLAQYCKIKVPNVRAISNAAEGDKIERDSLKANIEKLYVEPFHHGIYEGPRSPRDLFLKPLIMLMDLALGKILFFILVLDLNRLL